MQVFKYPFLKMLLGLNVFSKVKGYQIKYSVAFHLKFLLTVHSQINKSGNLTQIHQTKEELS